jgi:ankyrin repeat protein
MPVLHDDESAAVDVVAAIRGGDLDALRLLLAARPGLATSWIRDRKGVERSLPHVVADWPGHFPRGAETVAVLAAAGADMNARLRHGPHEETPLHWAASCDDVAVLDALLDAGAAIDAPGAVIAGGTPLADATAFAQWRAAFRLVERGAATTSFTAAALGLTDRVRAHLAASPADLDDAFWAACHGGRLEVARFLAGEGADLSRVAPWEPATPLDAAKRTGAADVVTWLREHGARSA